MGLATARKLAAEGMNLCIVHRDSRSSLQAFSMELESMRKSGVKCLSFNKNALITSEIENILKELEKAMGKGEKVKLLLHSIARGNLKSMVAQKDGERMLAEDDLMITVQSMAVSYYSWIKTIREKKMFSENSICIGLTSEGNSRAWPYYAAVSAAKASLESISRSVALELGKHGIRSNIIQAGVTDTPSFRMIPGSDKLKENALKRNPLNRLTRPGDVADVVYLLCKEEANWINGAVIPVDGGERIA